jgi:hypothetical protein
MKVLSPFIKASVLKEKVSKGRSATVPDQALKVRDIMNRFIKGQSIEHALKTQQPVWPETVSHDSPDLNQIRNMDKMDKADLARSFHDVKWKDKPDGKTPTEDPPAE